MGARAKLPTATQARKTVDSSMLWDKTLGVGDPNSADRTVGKQAARWASINLTGGGSTPGSVIECDVPHDLGEVPTVCTLESFENAAVAGTFIVANAARRENWSHSHVHMSVRLVSGSFDGCRANFKVQGR